MDFGAIFWISILLLIWGGSTFGLWKLFEKAGQPGWAALIPGYNWYIWLQVIGKPVWWVVLLIIPVVNVLVGVAMVIELAKAFGKYKLGQHAAALLLGFFYFPKMGLDPKVKYQGPPESHEKTRKKTQLREWGDALLFAGVAALIIRTFFIEAFMIPTSSMERTLMAGDFLFVSKFHYGPRMPMVPLSIPFIHNKINFTSKPSNAIPSYLNWIQLPYYRFPGFVDVKRNDIVVFNYPAHDQKDLHDGAGLVQEISMKENYIKRCVAVPGDTLEVRRQQVYINGKEGYNPPHMQYEYIIRTNGQGFEGRKIARQMKEFGMRRFITKAGTPNPNANLMPSANSNNQEIRLLRNAYVAYMPDSVAKLIKALPNVIKVDTVSRDKGVFDKNAPIYPEKNNNNGELFQFNMDWYGPIVVPKAGMKIELDAKNLSLYWRVITAYEGHKLEQKNGKVLLDGKETTQYTFEMDYYWMMGDNRHNSQDSRVWGFVPENHIVGKPLFVFFSYESHPDHDWFWENIRWSRIGTRYVH